MKQLKYRGVLMALAAVFLSAKVGAQVTHPGFVQTDVLKKSGITTDTGIYNQPVTGRQSTRTYMDGLGRTIQTVGIQASPLQHDIVQPQVYDNLGRQMKTYLPYAGQATDTIGSYRTNALTAQKGFWDQTTQYLIAVDTGAYAQQTVEKSPLQRTASAGQIGGGFQPISGQHYKTVSYRPNNSTSDGNIYQTGPAGTFSTTYYSNGTLWVTDAKDEDNHETLTFTDIAGRTILKRQVTGITGEPYYDTYYVYNNAGLLKYIVPPKAVHLIIANGYTITSAQIVNLIYTYTYNVWGQLTSKKVPNAGTSYIIYDPLNRPVLARDSNMAAKNQWSYIKYDAKGRVIITGVYFDATHTTAASMQSYVSGLSGYNTTWCEGRTTVTTYHSYTNNVFPTSGTTPLAYSFYDNYDITGDGNYDYTYKAPSGLTTAPVACTDSLKGVPTMTQKSTVGPGMSTEWLTTVTFYDRYGRAIQTRSNNQLNYTSTTALTDTSTTVLDFTGKPLQTKVTKVTGSGTANTNSITTTFNYDNSNAQLSSIDQVYNAQAKKRIAAYTYNETGQLILKKLDSLNGAWLQNVDFRYNIRGQLTSINNSSLSPDTGKTNNDSNDLFGMQIMYDKPDSHIGTVTPSYSGMISAVKWMARNSSNNKTNERSYIYNYDKVGRDTSAWYAERTAGSTSTFNINNHGFDEYGITYDEGGNILTLNRTTSSGVGATSHSQADKLTYGYDGTAPNKLNTVTDAGSSTLGFITPNGTSGSYSYDANGNLTSDPYKGLTIKYSTLVNRADSIVQANGAYISYTYDAAGAVIRKQVYSSTTTMTSQTDYVGGFVYTTQSGATSLTYIQNAEGRLMNTGSGGTVTLTEEYIMADQQGNARFSFEDNGAGILIRQENSYYPFGETFTSSTVTLPTTPNKNLYNGGSEWQNDYSNLPDYQQTFFRNYDAEIGRFIAVDPMPESAQDMTVYQYAGNNPVMANDPNGDKIVPYRIGGGSPNGSFGAFATAHAHALAASWQNDFDQWVAQDNGDSGGGDVSGSSGGSISNPGGINLSITSQKLISQLLGNMQNGTSFSFDFSSNGGWTEYYNNEKINQNDTEFTGMAGIADYGSNKGFSISNDANQGGNVNPEGPWLWGLIGSTQTVRGGWELEADDGKYFDRYSIAGYQTQTHGKEGLINFNTTTLVNKYGTALETTSEANLNLEIYKFKVTSDFGLSQQFGTDSWNLNIGLSFKKGLTVGGAVNGYGLDASARPGLGTAAGVAIGAAVITVGGLVLAF